MVKLIDEGTAGRQLWQHFRQLGSATLAESGAQVIASPPRPVWPNASVAGPAFTVQCASGDNLAVHAALEHAPRGVVLAVALPDQTPRGYWGEVLTTAAEKAGLLGLVIDGTVRDTAAIERHGFPVFARGTALHGATKNGPGSLGATISLGGVIVSPGDVLVADSDGVVVVHRSLLDPVLRAANARAEKEREFFTALGSGTTTVQLLGLDTSSISAP